MLKSLAKILYTVAKRLDPQPEIQGNEVSAPCAQNDAEQALRDQVVLTRAIIENSPNALFLKDTDGRFTLVNRGWSVMSGLSPEQALGKTVHEIYPASQAKSMAEEDAKLIAMGAAAPPIEAVHHGPRPDQWRIVKKMVLTREDGTVQGLLSTSTDISALKRAETELRDQIALTRALVDSNPNAMYQKDTEGRYVIVNDAWVAMLGVPRERAIGHTMLELIPEEASVPASTAEDRRLIEHGDGSSEIESFRTGADGRPQWLIERRAVLKNAEGKVMGLIGTNTDVTRFKHYEQELADRAKFVSELLDALPIWVGMRDENGRYLLVNRTWERIFGVTRDIAIGKRRRELPGWENNPARLADAAAIEQSDAALLARGPGVETEPQEITRMEREYLTTRRVIADSAGKVMGVLSVGMDVTERNAMAEELRQSVKVREEVERMSRHDLKTPLNSVIAMTRLLRDTKRLAPEDAELLGTIERAGYRILNMVNLSLDLFRMEMGSYEFVPKAVDLGEVARRVAADLESQAASKNVDVRVRVNGASAATQEALVRGDELLCYSMCANLVKNAIEAVPAGGTVSILIECGEADVVTEIHNPGAVPEALRERFFQKYASTGKSAGLGLGAYSARLMAKVQEGDLSMETSEDKGTRLIARFKRAGTELPRATESRTAEAREGAARSLPELRVFVVDDDEFNRLVLRRYLPSPPLEVVFAVNGRAALDAARDTWPDVVLLDLEMPVMDGYQAARALREMEREGGRKRAMIVAISSNNESHIAQRAIDAGCDRYIVKPAPRQELWNLLRSAGAGKHELVLPKAGIGEVSTITAARDNGTVIAHANDVVRVDDDLRQTLPEFFRSQRAALKEMPGLLANGDRAQFKRHAHRLAGSFSMCGFKWASSEARALESGALEGDAAQLARRTEGILAHLDTATIEYVAT